MSVRDGSRSNHLDTRGKRHETAIYPIDRAEDCESAINGGVARFAASLVLLYHRDERVQLLLVAAQMSSRLACRGAYSD